MWRVEPANAGKFFPICVYLRPCAIQLRNLGLFYFVAPEIRQARQHWVKAKGHHFRVCVFLGPALHPDSVGGHDESRSVLATLRMSLRREGVRIRSGITPTVNKNRAARHFVHRASYRNEFGRTDGLFDCRDWETHNPQADDLCTGILAFRFFVQLHDCPNAQTFEVSPSLCGDRFGSAIDFGFFINDGEIGNGVDGWMC